MNGGEIVKYPTMFYLSLVIVFILFFSLQAEQKLPGPDDDSRYGQSVSIAGVWTVIGAPEHDNSNGTDAGAVFVYHFNGTTWDSIQMLKAYGGDPGDGFGYSVSVSGNYLIVGAPFRQNGAGAIYIFHYDGNNWSQQALFKPGIIGMQDNYGVSVDIEGDYFIVGADRYNYNSGIAFIYVNQNGTWTEQAQLEPATLSYGWSFGRTVAIYDEAALVGAPGRDNGFEDRTGTAYLFRRSGPDWSEEEQLFPTALSGEQTSKDSQFGTAVDLFHNYAVIGAIGDDQNGPYSDTGAAYIYFYNAGAWELNAKLKLSNFINGDEFGRAVAIYGDYALVGSPRRDETGRNSGAVFAYLREDTSWVLKDTQTAGDIDSLGYFGCAVAIDSAYAVAGSGFDARGDSSTYQSAYIYHNQNDLNLLPTISGIGGDASTARDFRLSQNYPNPFNPITAISYRLSAFSHVELNIYNILGQRVAQLVSAQQPAGEYTVYWNAQNFPGGVYFYILTADKGLSQTRKMILLK